MTNPKEEFTLAELRVIDNLLTAQNAAFHVSVARIAADLKDKVDAKIADASAREERTQAAAKLHSVPGSKKEGDAA